MSDPGPTGSVQGETCDGGYACLAVEHIEGCFTGERDPDAAKGLYVARLRAEVERLTKRLAEAEAVVYGLCDAWGDGEYPPQDPHAGGVLHAIWCEAAGYHVNYRLPALAGSPLVSGEPGEIR